MLSKEQSKVREEGGQTHTLLEGRAAVLEILFLTVGVALGVNVVASSIFTTFKLDLGGSLIFGFSIIIIFIGWASIRTVQKAKRVLNVKGILLTNGKEKSLVRIDRYQFSEKTSDCLEAGFSENSALKRTWEAGPFYELTQGANGSWVRKSHGSEKLFREAVEYIILNSLSHHLSEHFNNNSKIDRKQIFEIDRNSIPSVLLQNRFLELFSRPMEDRPAFSSHGFSSSNDKDVVFAYGDNGAIFDKFELILPKGSRVVRVSERTILIRTRRFDLRISVVFEGFSGAMPQYFEQKYLGMRPYKADSYEVRARIAAIFRPSALLSPSGWESFKWIDSFFSRIENEFSFQHFIDRIGWEAAVTVEKVVSRAKMAPARSTRPTRAQAKDAQ